MSQVMEGYYRRERSQPQCDRIDSSNPLTVDMHGLHDDNYDTSEIICGNPCDGRPCYNPYVRCERMTRVASRRDLGPPEYWENAYDRRSARGETFGGADGCEWHYMEVKDERRIPSMLREARLSSSSECYARRRRCEELTHNVLTLMITNERESGRPCQHALKYMKIRVGYRCTRFRSF